MKRSLYLLLFLCVSLPSYALETLSIQPLEKVLGGVSVKPVSSSRTLTVPMITWGGDIATLVANGNRLETKSGSPFAKQGLKIKLIREDVFTEQLKSYMQGRSPFLRGTLGMIQQASDLLCRNRSTCPKIIYQMTWSEGGDALVVGPGIQTVADLRGKRIAVQAYGPHVDYLTKVLSDGGLSPGDVTLVWLSDLTGTENSPAEALAAGKADAAAVIIPDALALTSGGNVGTGAEGSVRGAKILLSTRTANRIIADVYAVRSDWHDSNPTKVEAFVRGLLIGQDRLATISKDRDDQYLDTFRFAAKALLDSSDALPDAEGLYADATFVGLQGNIDFLQSKVYPRRMSVLSGETASAFGQMGLMSGRSGITAGKVDLSRAGKGLADTSVSSGSRFNPGAVASVVTRRQQQGALSEGELFSFEIFFEPNQQTFSAALYRDAFDKVVELASTYGGSVITVEGHSDPLGYLRKKKQGEAPVILSRVKQAARNLSLSRASSVRDSLIDYASSRNVSLNVDQFALVPHGISQPKNGVCGKDPCSPASEREWRDNMRVMFRIIQVEAEESVFRPL